MTSILAPPYRYYLEGNMDQPELIDVDGGHVVAFSRVCPDKEDPNDDSAAIIHTSCGAIVLAVADGVGGAPLGYKASAIAMQCLVESLVAATLITDQHPTDQRPAEQRSAEQRSKEQQRPVEVRPVDLRPAILDGIEKANTEILDMGTGAATTISIVEVRNRVARGYQVGDSMALIVGQRGAIRWKSMSHSPVGYAIESGMIDEADAMNHDERHIVSNLVGSRSMHIEIGPAVSLSPRDSIVIASDGLFDNLHISEVSTMARVGRPLDRMNSLVKLATERMKQAEAGAPGKPDDLAILLMTP